MQVLQVLNQLKIGNIVYDFIFAQEIGHNPTQLDKVNIYSLIFNRFR